MGFDNIAGGVGGDGWCWVVGAVGWWVLLGSGGGGKFMLVLVFGGYREQNLRALLLRSRSALLLRSRSG